MSEQTMRHLRLADRARLTNARMKRELKEGLPLSSAIMSRDADRLKVIDLLVAQYGWSRDKALPVLRNLHISEGRRVGDLTLVQRAAIIASARDVTKVRKR